MFSRFASTKAGTRLLPVRSRASLLNGPTYYRSTPHFKLINHLLVSSPHLPPSRSFSSGDSTPNNVEPVNPMTTKNVDPASLATSKRP